MIVFAFALLASPVNAKWYVAESEHFVVYADEDRENMERFVTILERYDAALSLVTENDGPPPSPSNRLTVFVVGDRSDVRRLSGGNRFVAGFYVPRAAGSVAFVPDIKLRKGQRSLSLIVLLHEYAHHHMASGKRAATPQWLREGFAEYMAMATFGKDGSVELGLGAGHRFNELYFTDNVSVRELLADDGSSPALRASYQSYYGKSWLLYHYLTATPERAGQLEAYSNAVASGVPSAAAAAEAFGDTGVLERELERYLRDWVSPTVKYDKDQISIGEFTVSELDAGAEAILPAYMTLRRGVEREGTAAIVSEAREVAQRFPDNAFVQSVLAQAEYEAGNDLAAIAAADAAIAIEGGAKEAYLYKGYAQFRLAAGAVDANAAYASAMATFSELNGLENDHPVPLVQYYRSYVERGLVPPEQARHALERAAQLVPHDKYLWLSVAIMQAREGKIGLARMSLLPIATDTHDREASGIAIAMLSALQGAQEGEPFLQPAMAE
uniref:hypothetical protein n=1 Tax=Parerythrobacter lutipelagi TaxID=1964208 RepID=UPI00195756BD|nr:hypothetical protein [Parerythrobacter lutipelagi]